MRSNLDSTLADFTLEQKGTQVMMEAPMRNIVYITVFCLIICLTTVQIAKAQESTITIPIKEYIASKGPTSIIVRIYDQPQAGKLLHQTVKKVVPKSGMFADSIEVPYELVESNPRLFIEFSRQSAPSEEISEQRMQFSQPPASEHAGSVNVLLICFTCGGQAPFISGAVAGRTSAPLNIERGTNCSGSNSLRSDIRPNICYNIQR
jgi:hypothetical protein